MFSGSFFKMSLYFAPLVLALSLALVSGEEVLVYEDAEFASKISSHEVALVKFYAPWFV